MVSLGTIASLMSPLLFVASGQLLSVRGVEPRDNQVLESFLTARLGWEIQDPGGWSAPLRLPCLRPCE